MRRLLSAFVVLAGVALARDAQEAIAFLILTASQSRPVHLTFSDETVLSLASWTYSAPLHTLVGR